MSVQNQRRRRIVPKMTRPAISFRLAARRDAVPPRVVSNVAGLSAPDKPLHSAGGLAEALSGVAAKQDTMIIRQTQQVIAKVDLD